MKTSLFCLFLGMMSAAFSVELKTGTYIVNGTNPVGCGNYEGKVIIDSQGENYFLLWRIGSWQTFFGTGVFREADHVLSVSFSDTSGSFSGIISYKVNDLTGEIEEGKWATANSLSQGSEVLTWKNNNTD